jgi:hypothetical protein
MMPCQISCGNQDLILGYSEVCEMVQFRQYEETLCDRGLNLSYFLAEVLQKSFLQLSRGLFRLFADDAEAFVEFGEDLLRDECPRFYRLLDFRLLRVLTDLLIDLRLPFGPVSHIAEQHKENFFRASCWHRFSPLGEFVNLGGPT